MTVFHPSSLTSCHQCFEKGMKNIQAAYKSAQRKERGMEEHDSGIGCSDAECEIDMGSLNPAAESSRTASQRDQMMDDRINRSGGMGSMSGGGNMSIQSMLSPSPPASHEG
jgi:hypothetical protein